MWRREEGLRVANSPREPGIALRLIRKLAGGLGDGSLSADVSEQILNIGTNAMGLTVDIAPDAVVRDGLTFLGSRMDLPTAFSCKILTLNILKAAMAKNVALPNEQRARIRQADAINQPRLRTVHPVIPTPGIRTSARGFISLPAIKTEDMNISARPGNRILISQVLELPLVRSSIDINLLPDSEYEGFLREAEILKKLPPERCELQAIFRHVPIELISQLHFLAERNVIIYKISESRRTRTRIHDIAAVRDTGSQEIHLVPHRTRFRWASLN
jgi:hypothetical protein